jgi:Fic family protein
MAEFLDEKRREIDRRLKELRPLVDEHARLEAAAAALDGLPQSAGAQPSRPQRRRARTATAAKPTAAKPTAAKPRRRAAATSTGRRGRPKGSGTRANETLEIVTANPGISIPEIAEKMGIKQNYLYRVLPGLAENGLVEKDGRGWRPKQAA